MFMSRNWPLLLLSILFLIALALYLWLKPLGEPYTGSSGLHDSTQVPGSPQSENLGPSIPGGTAAEASMTGDRPPGSEPAASSPDQAAGGSAEESAGSLLPRATQPAIQPGGSPAEPGNPPVEEASEGAAGGSGGVEITPTPSASLADDDDDDDDSPPWVTVPIAEVEPVPDPQKPLPQPEDRCTCPAGW